MVGRDGWLLKNRLLLFSDDVQEGFDFFGVGTQQKFSCQHDGYLVIKYQKIRQGDWGGDLCFVYTYSYAANAFQYFFLTFIFMQGGVGSDRSYCCKTSITKATGAEALAKFCFCCNVENRVTKTTINHRGEGYRYTRT